MSIEEIRQDLQARLSDKRYRHSLAVADMARELALRNGGDGEQAYLAGLVHDCMRELPQEQALAYFREHGLTLTTLEQHSPNLWHAMLGAHAIADLFGIHDPDIQNAVRYHTTARAGMSLLERVVYVADCTSADRRYPDVEDVRRISRQCLNDGVRASLAFCMEDLGRKGIPVHPDTLAAAKEYAKDGCKRPKNTL